MFFEKFREAIARLPDGLIRPGPPSTPEAIAAAELQVGVALPQPLRDFLLSFDGADLFHEGIVIAGVGPDAVISLASLNARANGAVEPGAAELIFAETALGDRFAFSSDVGSGSGAVLRLRAGSDERTLSGSTFERWLAAMVAREKVLYGPDGEFAPDAFEPDGEEVTARTALRQAERALRQDPGSAEAEHERGTALRRLGREREAIDALTAATRIDPANPWAWFDLGRLLLGAAGNAQRAIESFGRAAALEVGPASARMLAWAARAADAAGDATAATTARREAVERHPQIADDLRRAVAAAAAEDDEDARHEAELLLGALTGAAVATPTATPRLRLPVVTEPTASAAPRPQPAARRHLPRAKPQRGGGSRRGSPR
ncbi:MAG TPA: SMI1/KNR4 family protein [Polyangia bacterium]|nr:SMI1/KNR4 family protein [Polyangia bacterium]